MSKEEGFGRRGNCNFVEEQKMKREREKELSPSGTLLGETKKKAKNQEGTFRREGYSEKMLRLAGKNVA